MSENKSSISKQTTYLGIGDYWDTRELDESFFTGPDLGIGPSTLVKKWISEKVAELPSR